MDRNHIIILDDALDQWECEYWLDAFSRAPSVKWHNHNGGTEPVDRKYTENLWRSDFGDKETCWVPHHTKEFQLVQRLYDNLSLKYEHYNQVRHVQIIRYGVDGMFEWYKDIADPADRATSLIALNDGYTGGDLVVEDLTIRGKQGRMVSFNNSTKRWHNVTPVLKGERFVLAVWLGDGTIPLEGHHE